MLLLDVFAYRLRMIEIVGEGKMDFRQPQTGEAEGNLFRGRALLIMVHDRVQDATWNFFIGAPSPFEEYAVTPEQVERAYQKTVRQIDRERKAGKLKLWKP